MKRIYFFAVVLLFKACPVDAQIVVGSKKFTESVILGEIARLALDQAGVPVRHQAELGGSRILWNALLSGDVDLYPEYTSTIEAELLKRQFRNFAQMREALARRGIGVTDPLGFNNTYALGMTKKRAEALGIRKISDLSRHGFLKIGFGEEFRRRRDGWPGLVAKYHLPQTVVRSMDHDIAYRAIQSGDIDLMDLYSTDPEIAYYSLFVLKDDLNFFPRYDAVFLYRLSTVKTEPLVAERLNRFAGKFPEDEMIELNRQAKIDRVPEAEVAASFLNRKFGITATVEPVTRGTRILHRTKEHLLLVIASLITAIFAAVPLGVWSARKPILGRAILGAVGAIQTIPSLALLVILIKPLNELGLTGIGDTPALVALFLYSLLPIVRGVHSGMTQIPLTLRETSEVLGLSRRTRLWQIELPLALPTILSGIKTAAVMNVGFATLGALVGAGGYGQPILTGIRLDDYGLILEGAIPSILLALLVQQLLDLSERFLISPGLAK